MEASLKHRSLYKASSPHWKETYRKRCVERLKSSRSQLLDRYRQVSESEPCGVQRSLLVQEVMEEEWKQLQLTNSLPSMWGRGNFSQVFGMLQDPDELALLEEVQQELILEEQRMVEEIERVLEFEEECLNSVIDLNAETQIVCPVCNRNNLTVTSHFVVCACGLYIHAHSRGLTVEKLQSLLGNHLAEHQCRCPHRPLFSVGTGLAGESHLFMSCQVCDTVAVIL
ncbi:RPA-interacting protein [Ambystoma mexicanum]|uniref:RPA-interacting protein n=1 Tax=Ambystoma mexicanum TaxID=8296 RepID=UPI0037E943C9